MPSFDEIYNNHADRYDRLLRSEDWQNNLRRTLHEITDWTGKTVIEAGIGTGRVSRLYLDEAGRMHGYDRSAHMLDRAAENLAPWQDKMELSQKENLKLGELTTRADIFIEGWSFGHTVYDGPGNFAENTETLVKGCLKLLAPGGTAIIIETLSTNAKSPAPPADGLAEFYSLLENRYNFTRHEVSTDYRFESIEEAVENINFFFGEEMADAVREMNSLIIPEWTGVWTRSAS